MKHVWVLSVRTSLPNTCRKTPLETKSTVFTDFAAARGAMREAIRGYAFSKNAMFDGDGHLHHLVRYGDCAWDPDEKEREEFGEEWCLSCITPAFITRFSDALQGVFAGREVSLQGFADEYTDGMLAIDFSKDSVSVYGNDDGPCNGYDPVIRTNCFSMQEEKEYYLYLNDLFGQDEASAELYIELRQAQLL